MRRICPHDYYTTLPHDLNKKNPPDLMNGPSKGHGKTMEVQVGKDQEMAQAEKDSHYKIRDGKKLN